MTDPMTTIQDPEQVNRLLHMFHVHHYDRHEDLSRQIGEDRTGPYHVLDGKVYHHDIYNHTIHVHDYHEFQRDVRPQTPGYRPR